MAKETAFAQGERKEKKGEPQELREELRQKPSEGRKAIPKEEMPQPALAEERLDLLAKAEAALRNANSLLEKAVARIPAGKQELSLEDVRQLDEARRLFDRALSEVAAARDDAGKLSKETGARLLADAEKLGNRALYGEALVHQLKCTLYDNEAGNAFAKEMEGGDVERYEREGGEFEEKADAESARALKIYAKLTSGAPTPETVEVYNNAALAFLRNNEFDEALAVLKKIVGSHLPAEVKIGAMLGRSAVYREKAAREEDGEAALGIYGQALAECDSALQLQRHNEAALLERARVHSEMGEIEGSYLEKALDDYREVASLLAGKMRAGSASQEQLAAVYLSMAEVCEKLGRESDAGRYRSEAEKLA